MTTFSKACKFYFFVIFTVPLTPTGLRVTSATTTVINLAWSAASGSTQDSYVVTVTRQDTGALVTSFTVTSTTAQVRNLTPGRGYSTKVQAKSHGVLSASSSDVHRNTGRNSFYLLLLLIFQFNSFILKKN